MYHVQAARAKSPLTWSLLPVKASLKAQFGVKLISEDYRRQLTAGAEKLAVFWVLALSVLFEARSRIRQNKTLFMLSQVHILFAHSQKEATAQRNLVLDNKLPDLVRHFLLLYQSLLSRPLGLFLGRRLVYEGLAR